MDSLRKAQRTNTVSTFLTVPHQQAGARKAPGFILLELIIVLFLISIIISLSAIFFANSLPSYKFNATVRNISSTIKQARSLARIHDEIQTVTIDMESRQYALEGHAPKDIPADIAVKVIDPVAGEIHTGKYHFVLYPTSGVEGGTIVLWNSKRSVSIQLDPVVGTVMIK
jgi:type II secretory pathway pseudopilin PulG